MAERLGSIEALDLTRWIRPGDTVSWAQACAEPLVLTGHLMRHRAAIGRFRCFVGLGLNATIRPEHTDHVTVVAYTGAGANRALSRTGALEILPSHYSELPILFSERRFPVDVVFVQLSPPDRRGRHSLGLGDEWLSAAIDNARVVIAEVNDRVPWTHSRLLTDSDLDVIVETSYPPVELPRRDPRGRAPDSGPCRRAGRGRRHARDRSRDAAGGDPGRPDRPS
jgi:acyl-CoA hydrolase